MPPQQHQYNGLACPADYSGLRLSWVAYGQRGLPMVSWRAVLRLASGSPCGRAAVGTGQTSEQITRQLCPRRSIACRGVITAVIARIKSTAKHAHDRQNESVKKWDLKLAFTSVGPHLPLKFQVVRHQDASFACSLHHNGHNQVSPLCTKFVGKVLDHK